MRHDLEAIVARHREEWVTSTRGADLPRGSEVGKGEALGPRYSMVSDPKAQERAARLRAQGLSTGEIASRLGTNERMVHRLLERRGKS